MDTNAKSLEALRSITAAPEAVWDHSPYGLTMKRIRQALARISGRPYKPSPDLKSTSAESIRPARRISIDEEGTGALILHDGSDATDGEKSIDIVLVHGLEGNRIRSWQKNGVCWPRDLLDREIPNARIITWGYTIPDFSVLSNGNSNGKYTYAQIATQISDSLVADVSKVCEKSNRDIIFIAHGLGGLIVKDALSTSAVSQVFGKHTDEFGNIYSKTRGIIFLGTPHRGSGRESLGTTIAAVTQIESRRQDDHLVHLALENSELFETQRDEFILVSRDIHVVCMREQLPTPAATMLANKSAAYDGLNVTTDDIYADHMNIARFASRQDPGYFQLVGHISRLSRRAKLEDTEAKMVRNREILDALHFDMREKADPSDEGYGQTCSSVLSSKKSHESASSFHQWLQTPGEPVFWISGNPGSGKTTLMRHAFHSLETRSYLERWAGGSGQLIMAGVFLFEGGTYVQKSREGILRGMLYQILSARPQLIPICFPSFMAGPWPPNVPFNTTVNLSQAFYQLFSRTSKTLRLCMFIDGLDEYRLRDGNDEDSTEESTASVSDSVDGSGAILGSSKWLSDSHNEIAALIMELGNQEHVKMCVSSRELPPFEDAFNNVPRLRVHMQTEGMISQYCADRLDSVSPGLSVSQKALCDSVSHKSQGDILWARLAIDILMEGSLKKLNTTLDSLPTQLGGYNGLYMRMIQNLSPNHQREACRIFQIILRCQDPPNLATLAFAEEGYLAGVNRQRSYPDLGELLVSHDKIHPFAAQDLEHVAHRMEKRLATSCAGLLETTNEKLPRVVFMHLTTKEFVLREHIWDSVLVTPPSKVEIDFSLISGSIRYLNATFVAGLRPILVKRPQFQFDPEAWLLIANILRYAARVDDEPFDRSAYCELLDELDSMCQTAWMRAVKEYVPANDASAVWYKERLPALLKSHWSAFEPMEVGPSPRRRNFLSLAVQANLFNYVATKLAILGNDEREAMAQALLEYAVSPEGDSRAANESGSRSSVSACASLTGNYKDFHHDMPDESFVRLLLDHGADAGYDSDVWVRTLKNGLCYFTRQSLVVLNLANGSNHILQQNRRRWVLAIKTMLGRGANPHLQVQIGGGEGGEGSIEVKSALDIIRDTLDGKGEFAKDLIMIEALVVGSTGRAN